MSLCSHDSPRGRPMRNFPLSDLCTFRAHTFRIIILGLLRSPFCPPFPSPRTESSPSIVFIYRGSKQWILFACIIDGTILLFRVSGSIWYEFLDHVDRYQFWITFGSGFKIDLC